MELEEHEKESIQYFGKPYTEIHNFLDQFYRHTGAKHRKYYHHLAGLKIIKKRFGEDAVKVAKKHIISDLESCGRWKLGIDEFPENSKSYDKKLLW